MAHTMAECMGATRGERCVVTVARALRAAATDEEAPCLLLDPRIIYSGELSLRGSRLFPSATKFEKGVVSYEQRENLGGGR